MLTNCLNRFFRYFYTELDQFMYSLQAEIAPKTFCVDCTDIEKMNFPYTYLSYLIVSVLKKTSEYVNAFNYKKCSFSLTQYNINYSPDYMEGYLNNLSNIFKIKRFNYIKSIYETC